MSWSYGSWPKVLLAVTLPDETVSGFVFSQYR
jgi:hypothetical protein